MVKFSLQLGWNTWCTQNQCGNDWCTEKEIISVGKSMKENGFYWMLDMNILI